ncbi:MAG: DUF4153 domain-containing protein [Firmicutes bacterium]|nr:DUF4153 domain-containing protein [Bacillota bacterium]
MDSNRAPAAGDPEIKNPLIDRALSNPVELERSYRTALAENREDVFRGEIKKALETGRETPLLTAWGLRLDLLPLESGLPEGDRLSEDPKDKAFLGLHHWFPAIGLSIVLGLAWLLLAGEGPAMPFPVAAKPAFWLGWGPTGVTAALTYLWLTGTKADPAAGNKRVYASAAVILALLTFWSGWFFSGRGGAVAGLAALHLPLVAMLTLGYVITYGDIDRVKSRFFIILKSLDFALSALIYILAAGMAGALTLGIFRVLGVEIPPAMVQRTANFVLGTIPVLALASVYSPGRRPEFQDVSHGPLRILRLFSRLALPVVIGILLVYLVGFLPWNFTQPLQSRDLLLVYNGTIVAILFLMVAALPLPLEKLDPRLKLWLRRGLSAASGLALLLNLYALTAVVLRVGDQFGWTPNRHAVIGWNAITLVILAGILLDQRQSPDDEWVERFQGSITRLLPAIGLWGL